jgi:hypothetical protein
MTDTLEPWQRLLNEHHGELPGLLTRVRDVLERTDAAMDSVGKFLRTGIREQVGWDLLHAETEKLARDLRDWSSGPARTGHGRLRERRSQQAELECDRGWRRSPGTGE